LKLFNKIFREPDVSRQRVVPGTRRYVAEEVRVFRQQLRELSAGPLSQKNRQGDNSFSQPVNPFFFRVRGMNDTMILVGA